MFKVIKIFFFTLLLNITGTVKFISLWSILAGAIYVNSPLPFLSVVNEYLSNSPTNLPFTTGGSIFTGTLTGLLSLSNAYTVNV